MCAATSSSAPSTDCVTDEASEKRPKGAAEEACGGLGARTGELGARRLLACAVLAPKGLRGGGGFGKCEALDIADGRAKRPGEKTKGREIAAIPVGGRLEGPPDEGCARMKGSAAARAASAAAGETALEAPDDSAASAASEAEAELTPVVLCVGALMLLLAMLLNYQLKRKRVVVVTESGASMLLGLLTGWLAWLFLPVEPLLIVRAHGLHDLIYYAMLPPIIFVAGCARVALPHWPSSPPRQRHAPSPVRPLAQPDLPAHRARPPDPAPPVSRRFPDFIMMSSYTMRKQYFFKNFFTILLLAVPGTLVAALAFGAGLYRLVALRVLASPTVSGVDPLLTCLLFGALIASTDPVATLSILKEVRAPTVLANVIFGESALNDAVSIVIFNVRARDFPRPCPCAPCPPPPPRSPSARPRLIATQRPVRLLTRPPPPNENTTKTKTHKLNSGLPRGCAAARGRALRRALRPKCMRRLWTQRVRRAARRRRGGARRLRNDQAAGHAAAAAGREERGAAGLGPRREQRQRRARRGERG